MTSSGTELIKLQEDTMKLQQRLYISLIPYTSADDKIKMLQNLRPQSNTITAFKQNMAQESSQRRTETVKPGGISKEDQGKLVKNYVRLVAELPTTNIADYLKQNHILTEEMVEKKLNKETLKDRNRQLLSILFRRGSKAFPCLIDG
jgi:hypothetical protein